MKTITPRTKKARLRKLATRLEATPRRNFNQNFFCNTACCVAGHAILEFGMKVEKEKFLIGAKLHKWPFDIPARAQDLLGLATHERGRLFRMTDSWRAPYITPQGNVTPWLAAKALRDLANSIHL